MCDRRGGVGCVGYAVHRWLFDPLVVDFTLARRILCGNRFDTDATDDTLETLQELPGLKRLNVQGTKVTADAVKQFRKALPKCKVAGP